LRTPHHRIRIDRLVLDGLHLSDAQLSALPHLLADAVAQRLQSDSAEFARAEVPSASSTVAWNVGMSESVLAEGIGHAVARHTAARLKSGNLNR
jgi:hypothetical protein